MRVAVDARQMFRPQPRGIGKTLVSLYAALARARPAWRFDLVHQLDVPPPAALAGLPNVSPRRVDFRGADRLEIWERVALPWVAWRLGADLLHSPANTGPGYSRVPVVATVHDLIPLALAPRDPATHEWLAGVRRVARRARRVIAVSEHTKGELVRHLGLAAEKIAVVPWAPDPGLARVTDPAELDAARAAFGLEPGEPYLFGFGAADPRKNTARLIRAYAALPEGLRAGFRLLLVGIQPAALPGFRELAASLNLGDRAALHGFADEAVLPALLSGAAALAFPSQHEGFGLPLLDAFVCGTPVLAGDRTSLPEVGGDAALYADPDSDDAVRAGLERLLGDAELRRTLAERGTERAKLYTWERAAEATAGAFEVAFQASRER